MKKIIIILLMMSTSIFAQKKVQNYKYVIVPNKFEFLKEENQYQVNSLTKFLFKKYGFTVFSANEILPNDLAQNNCLALTGSVKDKSSLFKTISVIEFKDCYGKLIFSSKEGKSKQKQYKKAYYEAIRNAFKSIENLKYKYTPLASEKIAIQNEKMPKITANNSVVNLYAQPTTNGFQLINTVPTIIFQLLKTSVKDVYILKNKNGIIYKNNDIWIAEYYNKEVKIIEKYQIKF